MHRVSSALALGATFSCSDTVAVMKVGQEVWLGPVPYVSTEHHCPTHMYDRLLLLVRIKRRGQEAGGDHCEQGEGGMQAVWLPTLPPGCRC
jgi:ABC-type dipeptide/oligopeptide/nickel transport system ATPase component